VGVFFRKIVYVNKPAVQMPQKSISFIQNNFTLSHADKTFRNCSSFYKLTRLHTDFTQENEAFQQ